MGLGMGFAMANRFMGGAGNPMAGGPAPAPGHAAPPPPPPQQTFHVAVDGQTQGPFTPQQIASGVSSGQVSPTTLVWTAGMDGWKAASEVPQLSAAFAQTPPPPPPPIG
jgi:hypothetical protein